MGLRPVQVAADVELSRSEPVEQDIIYQRCLQLRTCMRKRPCLPEMPGPQELGSQDIESGMQLPLYSCPWRMCRFDTNSRARFLHHIAGGVADSTHRAALQKICPRDLQWMSNLDYVYGAVAIAERER